MSLCVCKEEVRVINSLSHAEPPRVVVKLGLSTFCRVNTPKNSSTLEIGER